MLSFWSKFLRWAVKQTTPKTAHSSGVKPPEQTSAIRPYGHLEHQKKFGSGGLKICAVILAEIFAMGCQTNYSENRTQQWCKTTRTDRRCSTIWAPRTSKKVRFRWTENLCCHFGRNFYGCASNMLRRNARNSQTAKVTTFK